MSKQSHIMGYEQFLFEKAKVESTEPNAKQLKAIEVLDKELDWNPHTIKAAGKGDLEIYGNVKNFNDQTGLVYWGMAGQSLVKDIQDALSKNGIKAKVNRGYETSRRSEDHDYIITLL